MHLAVILVVTLATLISSNSADAVEQWKKIAATNLSILRVDGAADIELRPAIDQGFSRSIKLVARSRKLDLLRVVVEYGNGQRDDVGAMTLEKDVETVIVERASGDYLSIASVRLSTSPHSGPVESIELLALQEQMTEQQPSIADRLRGIQNTKGNARAENKHSEFLLQYATTRKRDHNLQRHGKAIAAYSSEHSAALALGTAIVTIPTRRERGTMNRPLVDWQVFDYRMEDPSKHFTVAAVDESEQLFAKALRDKLKEASQFKRQALVFIHGYNTSFEDAAFRAAQLAHDVGFDGPVVVFSWAARSGLLNKVRYRADLEAATASRPGLRMLLGRLAAENGIEQVHLIAHSMGNQPTIDVLAERGRQPDSQRIDLKMSTIILAAPDVGEHIFETLSRDLAGIARSVTVYASKSDKAIVLSRAYSDTPRAGGVECLEAPSKLVSSQTFLIDVTQADTSFFGVNHSSFAERQHIITDLRLLLEKGTQPPEVRMPIYQRRGTAEAPCWRYQKN